MRRISNENSSIKRSFCRRIKTQRCSSITKQRQSKCVDFRPLERRYYYYLPLLWNVFIRPTIGMEVKGIIWVCSPAVQRTQLILTKIRSNRRLDPSISECCKENTVKKECVNDCNAPTCANRRNPPDMNTCNRTCYSNPCHCQDGLFMNAGMVCVPANKCDEACVSPTYQCTGQNEEPIACYKPDKARMCPNAEPSRQPSCQPDVPFGPEWYQMSYSSAGIAIDVCIENFCDCKDTFKRNECGLCVKEEDCGMKC